MPIDFSDERWPIFEVRVHGEMSHENIDALFDEFGEIVKRPGRHAQLIDLTQTNPLFVQPSHRTHFAKREKTIRDQYAHKVVAEARVVESAVVRGIATAVEWVVGNAAWPIKNFATEEQALEWLASLGAKPGATIPDVEPDNQT